MVGHRQDMRLRLWLDTEAKAHLYDGTDRPWT
jgi:hypothetical protein